MPSPSSSLRRARPLLGTLVEIRATGASAVLPAAFDAAFAAVERIGALMSFHDTGSDVSRINAAAAGCEVPVDPQTYDVLRRAVELGDLSDGRFDIATADVLVRAGFLPQHAPLPASPIAATYRDLELIGEHRVSWRRKGCIDLGGIAKGYAVDCAIAALRACGVFDGIVNAGGDLRCIGEAQPIHVRRPEAPTSLLFVGYLTDGAIATSGGYFSGVSGADGWIDPLVDPGRGTCGTWDRSVSVAARDCMTADALTKVVCLAEDSAPDLLASMDAQAIIVDDRRVGTCGARLLQQVKPR
jgi:FAD:protein FMN transferase